ncbi:MAG: hypothetical protein DRJ50_10420 [Actinobacteria bacterium]|nr:MAG: hypothetical protein DRJ50_10420 [Actinomycetota bacterium]
MSGNISEPIRSCIGCRQRRPQTALVRLTRTPSGIVVGGPSAGRGAWLCRDERSGSSANAECFDKAIANRGFARAWRGSVSAQEERIIREHIGLEADEDTERDGH